LENPAPNLPVGEETPHWLRKIALDWPRQCAGWIGDLVRLAWGFFFLNLRKTLFVRARKRFPCPCQNPSDSGRAMETSCDPVSHWAKPERFRRLCPLLKRAPDGQWRCSVATADVRPFWGRAFASLGISALALYLCAALAGFCALRAIGYPVSYVSVAWPPSWHDIRRSRAVYFYRKADAAFRGKRPAEAVMALSQGYQLDPGNYNVGLLLARFSQPGWGEVSNRIYQKLMNDHPEHQAETAQAWFLELLSAGDFSTMESLAASRVATNTAWLQAALFASRRTGDGTFLRRLARADSGAPLYVRQVCTLELAIRTTNLANARRILRQPVPPSPAPFLVYYWIDRDVHAGMPDEALVMLKRYGSLLGSRDMVELLIEVYQAEGWQALVRGEVDRLLALGANETVIELVSANLIRHPDPYILGRLFDAAYQRPLPAGGDRIGAYTSLFCAAGVAGDWVRMQASAAGLKSVTGSQLPGLETGASYFRGSTQPRVSLNRCLRSLPGVPIDVTYALYDFADSRRDLR